MQIVGLVFFSLIAAAWIFQGLRVACGVSKIPFLRDSVPAEDPACPSISMIFAARDEEEKLPAALATLASIDYPNLEIIAVDDRSQDATGRILDEFAATHSRCRAVHVLELPDGWLGKPHALQKAYEVSRGEWLLFTDADVRFERSVLRRSAALVQRNHLDHFTLLSSVEMHGFWEKTLITFFGLAFFLSNDTLGANNPKSRSYIGVGAFQIVRRSVYEAIGTHRRLAMEVVDDMKLAKLVKQGGFRSCVGIAQEFIIVRWHSGLRNMIRGVTKNFYAAFGYNFAFATAAVAGVFAMNVLPFASVFAGHGWIRILSGIAVGIALLLHSGANRISRVSPLYALTHPVGGILFCYMVARSVAVTLWQGGVTWRGTFYPLKELRKGVV